MANTFLLVVLVSLLGISSFFVGIKKVESYGFLLILLSVYFLIEANNLIKHNKMWIIEKIGGKKNEKN